VRISLGIAKDFTKYFSIYGSDGVSHKEIGNFISFDKKMDNTCKLNLEWIPAAYATAKSTSHKNEAETIKKAAPIVKTKSLYQTNTGLGKNKKNRL